MAPLSGVLFLIGVIAAAFVTGDAPDLDAPAQEVLGFYSDNSGQQFGGAVIQAWAAVFVVLFAVSARLRFDATAGSGWPGGLVALGGVLLAAGLLFDSVVRATLGEAGDDGQAQVVQTLHYLSDFSFFPLAGGVTLLTAGLGLAILRTGYLPRPLGWVAIAGAVLMMSPVFFVGLAIGAIAVLATSIALASGGGAPAAESPATAG